MNESGALRTAGGILRFALTVSLLLTGCSRLSHRAENAEPAKLVPKAVCGSQDRPESVQGEVTLAERFAPGPKAAYRCNLELVGQYVGEGSSFSSTVYDHCAYYSTWLSPRLEHPGVTVLDVSDSRNPRASAWLSEPGMLFANESLQADARQKVLVGAGAWESTSFYVYDLSKDCAHPTLISATALPGTLIHYGRFAPDGKTFYGAIWTGAATPAEYYASPKYRPGDPPPSAVYAIDMSDPAKPKTIGTWTPPDKTWMSHSATVSADGGRIYVTMLRELDDELKSPNVNGLVILDVSDFQARRPNPQFRVVGTLFWDDSHYAQFATPMTVSGKPYIVFTDAVGSIGAGTWGHEADNQIPANACGSGKPAHGFPRIIDISNPAEPVTVSKLMLEVSDPARCEAVKYDPAFGYKYGSEVCSPDNDADAHVLACAYFEGGVRVFDIRNPAQPREIAYYKPPAVGNAFRAANPIQTQGMIAGGQKGSTARTADMVIRPTFHGKGDNLEIWFNSLDNGFQVLRFTDEFKAREKDLFAALRGPET
jgi:hypothetical protein